MIFSTVRRYRFLSLLAFVFCLVLSGCASQEQTPHPIFRGKYDNASPDAYAYAITETSAELKKEAEAGDVLSQKTLGFAYLHGLLGKKDHQEAFKWTLMAAKKGDAYSQFLVGAMYLNGIGVKKNEAQAEKWLQAADKNGYKPRSR